MSTNNTPSIQDTITDHSTITDNSSSPSLFAMSGIQALHRVNFSTNCECIRGRRRFEYPTLCLTPSSQHLRSDPEGPHQQQPLEDFILYPQKLDSTIDNDMHELSAVKKRHTSYQRVSEHRPHMSIEEDSFISSLHPRLQSHLHSKSLDEKALINTLHGYHSIAIKSVQNELVRKKSRYTKAKSLRGRKVLRLETRSKSLPPATNVEQEHSSPEAETDFLAGLHVKHLCDESFYTLKAINSYPFRHHRP